MHVIVMSNRRVLRVGIEWSFWTRAIVRRGAVVVPAIAKLRVKFPRNTRRQTSSSPHPTPLPVSGSASALLVLRAVWLGVSDVQISVLAERTSSGCAKVIN